MIRKGLSLIGGGGVKARALRGTGFTLIEYAGSNGLRLASNLVLTRILFPEAFGLMALVQVFVTGLQLFSDTGIRISIIQNERGDDPRFLNTAWTIQVGRGFLLWLATCALALPMAALYDQPMLAYLLPVVGLNTVISGFNSTKAATVNRHMMLGRLTAINLTNQAFTVLLTVLLAWWLQSVWALVIGGLIGNAAKVAQYHYRLPGENNRFAWDREAAGQLFHFGKWIFLSTAAGFVINQGDRAILGGYIGMAELGVYTIGFFLGNISFGLSQAINSKVVFPLYRMKRPAESETNRRNVFRARRLVTAGLLCVNVALAFGGIFVVDLLYDPRYALAGPVVVLMSIALVPRMVLTAYGSVLLANGDSRQYTILLGSTAILQTVFLFLGITWLGLFGAIIAPAVAALLVYPLRIASVRRYDAWDPVHDALFLGAGGLFGGIACWIHWDRISQLFG